MTAEAFVRWAESYYGEYRPVVKAELLEWLSEKPAHLIAGLRLEVRDTFSTQYRTPPDVAILNKLKTDHSQLIYDRGREALQIAEHKQKRLT